MHDASPSTRVWTGTDALVLTAAILWGANYSILKLILRKLPPPAFAAMRLLLASLVFLAAIAISRWLRRRSQGVRETIVDLTPGGTDSLAIFRVTTLSGRDWRLLVALAIFGHFLYQLFFIEGLARTSVANASLMIGCTPIAVALASAALGQERLTIMHWIGAALSLGGIYLVVALGGTSTDAMARASLTGDALMAVAVTCWVIYTLLGRELLQRHSPLIVTGYSMALGAVPYVFYAAGPIAEADWVGLTTGDWLGIAYATFLAFNVSYILWYAGIQRLGSARTSLYSNLVPIVSLVTAAVWLGERVGWVKIVGAAAVLTGLLVSRVRLTAPD